MHVFHALFMWQPLSAKSASRVGRVPHYTVWIRNPDALFVDMGCASLFTRHACEGCCFVEGALCILAQFVPKCNCGHCREEPGLARRAGGGPPCIPHSFGATGLGRGWGSQKSYAYARRASSFTRGARQGAPPCVLHHPRYLPGAVGLGAETWKATRERVQVTRVCCICTCICIYIYIYINVYVYVYIYLYIYTYILPKIVLALEGVLTWPL